MIYSFGKWELDLELYELRCAEQPVRLQPKVFNVLAYLLQHRHRVVSKQELLSSLWSSQFISNSALERCIMMARKAIGDSSDQQRIIQTFHCRGYRFVASATERMTDAAHSLPPQMPIPHGPDWSHQSGEVRENGARNEPDASGYGRTAMGYDPKRKHVTVLSCTLAHTQPLAEPSRAVAFCTLLERFLDLEVRPVQGDEDMIIHCRDDGFLGLFGATRPCEDHALRALQIALKLQDYLNGDPLECDVPLRNPALRMGLHTGHVIGKRLGNDPRVIYMAVGDTMQVATDLQTCADPGDILMSEMTYRLVQEAVYGEVVGLVPVGANFLPVAAYKIYRLLSPQPSEMSLITPRAMQV